MRRSNLLLRVATAAVGLPLLGALVFAGGWVFALAAGVVAALAATEFIHGWLFAREPIRAVRSQWAAIAATAALVAGAHWNPLFLAAGGVAALVLAAVWLGPFPGLAQRAYLVVAGCLVYVGLPLAAIVLVRDVEGGRDWVLLGLLATFAVDTGAYATGRLFGRHRMAPRISPKKTWEGAAGGYAAGVGTAFAVNYLLDTGVPATTFAHFAFAMPVAAELGDLAESWMKRRMGVKDASGLLPGHGGFLDRLDSVVAVLPLLYLFLRLRVL